MPLPHTLIPLSCYHSWILRAISCLMSVDCEHHKDRGPEEFSTLSLLPGVCFGLWQCLLNVEGRKERRQVWAGRGERKGTIRLELPLEAPQSDLTASLPLPPSHVPLSLPPALPTHFSFQISITGPALRLPANPPWLSPPGSPLGLATSMPSPPSVWVLSMTTWKEGAVVTAEEGQRVKGSKARGPWGLTPKLCDPSALTSPWNLS